MHIYRYIYINIPIYINMYMYMYMCMSMHCDVYHMCMYTIMDIYMYEEKRKKRKK